MSKLPAKYQPSAPPVKAAGTLIDEPAVTNAEATEALGELGVIVSDKHLKNLEKVGIFAKTTGTLKLGRGQVMLTQARAERAMDLILKEMEGETSKKVRGKPKKTNLTALRALVMGLAALTKASTESQRLMLDIEQAKPGGATDDDEPPVRSFAPGAVVQPSTNIVAQHVHITPPQGEVQKKS